MRQSQGGAPGLISFMALFGRIPERLCVQKPIAPTKLWTWTTDTAANGSEKDTPLVHFPDSRSGSVSLSPLFRRSIDNLPEARSLPSHTSISLSELTGAFWHPPPSGGSVPLRLAIPLSELAGGLRPPAPPLGAAFGGGECIRATDRLIGESQSQSINLTLTNALSQCSERDCIPVARLRRPGGRPAFRLRHRR